MLDHRVVVSPDRSVTSSEGRPAGEVSPISAARANLVRAMREWERVRGRPVVAYVADERAIPAKTIDDTDVAPLYECLRSAGRPHRLDLVISTSGGKVSTARRLAHVVRQLAGETTAVVPSQARSAGTLLCLACDRILFGPLGELGPLDVQLTAANDGGMGPLSLSSADIREFREMVRQWFAVEDGLEAVRILSSRVFPPTLSSFYRAEQYIRTVAAEMLKARDPHACAEAEAIVDQLVAGYHTHDHALLAADARRLGLHVDETAGDETTALMDLWRAIRILITSSSQTTHDSGARVTSALIASPTYIATHWQPPLDAFTASVGDLQPNPALLSGGWDAQP
jgi:hypothetical protein